MELLFLLLMMLLVFFATTILLGFSKRIRLLQAIVIGILVVVTCSPVLVPQDGDTLIIPAIVALFLLVTSLRMHYLSRKRKPFMVKPLEQLRARFFPNGEVLPRFLRKGLDNITPDYLRFLNREVSYWDDPVDASPSEREQRQAREQQPPKKKKATKKKQAEQPQKNQKPEQAAQQQTPDLAEAPYTSEEAAELETLRARLAELETQQQDPAFEELGEEDLAELEALRQRRLRE